MHAYRFPRVVSGVLLESVLTCSILPCKNDGSYDFLVINYHESSSGLQRVQRSHCFVKQTEHSVPSNTKDPKWENYTIAMCCSFICFMLHQLISISVSFAELYLVNYTLSIIRHGNERSTGSLCTCIAYDYFDANRYVFSVYAYVCIYLFSLYISVLSLSNTETKKSVKTTGVGSIVLAIIK